MKHSKKIRGMSTAFAFAFAFMVFSFSFAPKAYAAEVEGNVTYAAQRFYLRAGTTWDYYTYNSTVAALPLNGVSLTIPAESGNLADLYLWLDGDIYFDGPVKLYASYYFTGSSSGLSENYFNKDDFIIRYTNSYAQTGYVNSLDDIGSFTNSSAAGGVGVYLEASYSGSEGMPISGLAVYRKLASSSETQNGLIVNGQCYIHYTSVRFISSAYSAELESLDKVADEIAAQSDILQAMKGDIVAILQDIYTMTGDMYIAQNLLNSYIAQLLPLIQSIDQTTTNIYALLSSQLAALETAINTSASTIESAIEAQTAAMIAYLEEMFNTGNEVPDETYQQQQDAENILDQMESLEKPDVNTIVPDIGDIGNDDISGALSSIFSSNLIVTMMTLSASLAFGAYVLFGKRG